MTLEQHIEFGNQLKNFRRAMSQHHILNCGKTIRSRENNTAAKTWDWMSKLASVMDDLVCRDFPDCEFATRIYYGPNLKTEIAKEP